MRFIGDRGIRQTSILAKFQADIVNNVEIQPGWIEEGGVGVTTEKGGAESGNISPNIKSRNAIKSRIGRSKRILWLRECESVVIWGCKHFEFQTRRRCIFMSAAFAYGVIVTIEDMSPFFKFNRPQAVRMSVDDLTSSGDVLRVQVYNLFDRGKGKSDTNVEKKPKRLTLNVDDEEEEEAVGWQKMGLLPLLFDLQEIIGKLLSPMSNEACKVNLSDDLNFSLSTKVICVNEE